MARRNMACLKADVKASVAWGYGHGAGGENVFEAPQLYDAEFWPRRFPQFDPREIWIAQGSKTKVREFWI